MNDSAEWAGRCSHRVLVFNEKLWVIGGKLADNDLTTCLNDVWSSEDGKSWKCEVAVAPWAPRASFAADTFNNRMWVMGGEGNGGIYSDVWYSGNGKEWTCVTGSAKWKLKDHESFVVDNKFWIAGGCSGDEPGDFTNDLWYTTNGNDWIKISDSIPWEKRISFSTAIFKNKIWIMCGLGSESGGPLNDIWSSSPPNITTGLKNQINAVHNGLSIKNSPIGSNVSISYQLNIGSNVRAAIFSSNGQEIFRLFNGVQTSGVYSLDWNGCNSKGEHVGNGIYYIHVRTGTGILSGKICR